MLRREFVAGTALTALIAALPARAQEGETEMTIPAKGHVPVNGIEMFYEIQGSGTPVVLLHGGITVYWTLGEMPAELAKSFQVIVPHMQGHGLTRDVADRPLDYPQMAKDTIALLDHLGIAKAHFVGYSMGGGVAMHIAMLRPELVDRLVIISTTVARDGWYPEVVKQFVDMPAQAPQLAEGIKQAPFYNDQPDTNWEALFRKMGEMERVPFDWSGDVDRIEAPTMLVFADADAIEPEHIMHMWRLFGGGQRDGGLDGSGRPTGRLAIIPNTTHYVLNTTEVTDAFVPFLEAAAN